MYYNLYGNEKFRYGLRFNYIIYKREKFIFCFLNNFFRYIFFVLIGLIIVNSFFGFIFIDILFRVGCFDF